MTSIGSLKIYSKIIKKTSKMTGNGRNMVSNTKDINSDLITDGFYRIVCQKISKNGHFLAIFEVFQAQNIENFSRSSGSIKTLRILTL